MVDDLHEGPKGLGDFIWWLVAGGIVIGLTFIFPGLEGARDEIIAITAFALVWKILSYLRGFRFLTVRILMAILFGAAVTLALGYAFRKTPRTLLYISPVQYPSKQAFYGRFIDELTRQGRAADLDTVVWTPAQDFSTSDQQRLLREAYQNRSKYRVIVFTPFKVEGLPEEDWLLKFTSDFGADRLILFDTDFPPRLRTALFQKRIGIPQCVGANEEKAGELAAEAVIRYLKQAQLTNPRVAIMDEHGASPRSQLVDKTLTGAAKEFPVQTEVWRTAEFSREEARRITLTKLAGGDQVDVIFSGNDVSALGVRDAILEMRERNAPSTRHSIRVMGYDGIDEVTELLRNTSENILLNSVNVSIPQEAGAIVALANAENKSLRPIDESCKAIDPYLVR